IEGSGSGRTEYIVTVVYIIDDENEKKLEKNVSLYVVKNQQIEEPVVPDLTVGLSEDNPCTTPEQLEQAIANVNDNGRIYLAGTNGVLELNGTFSLGKNCTLYSTVNGLQVKRKDNGTYFYVSSEVMIDATSKGITFTDDSDITEVSEGNGFFYGPGTLKAYSVAFENIKSNAVNVGNAVLSGCSFINISSNYGAVYVEAGKSARIGSCNFSGNTSKKSENYGDVYFVKDASSSLTLDENVTTDIGIYVDNAENVDPEIVFDATNYGGNLNITIKNGPKTGIDSMIILSCTGIPNQEKIRVIVDGSTDAYMSFTSGNDYCLTKTSF
ncbi:MAG: hypothetical protein Q4B64_11475, partial [Spirochaetales bacterium]|nr:hypothetical protein [Spirochaetales bacterium]